jgi:hypothetical protein
MRYKYKNRCLKSAAPRSEFNIFRINHQICVCDACAPRRIWRKTLFLCAWPAFYTYTCQIIRLARVYTCACMNSAPISRCVHHGDGCKYENRVCNLIIDTPPENDVAEIKREKSAAVVLRSKRPVEIRPIKRYHYLIHSFMKNFIINFVSQKPPKIP